MASRFYPGGTLPDGSHTNPGSGQTSTTTVGNPDGFNNPDRSGDLRQMIFNSPTYRQCLSLINNLDPNVRPAYEARLMSIVDSATYYDQNFGFLGAKKNQAAFLDVFNNAIQKIGELIDSIQEYVNGLPATERQLMEQAGYNVALNPPEAHGSTSAAGDTLATPSQSEMADRTHSVGMALTETAVGAVFNLIGLAVNSGVIRRGQDLSYQANERTNALGYAHVNLDRVKEGLLPLVAGDSSSSLDSSSELSDAGRFRNSEASLNNQVAFRKAGYRAAAHGLEVPGISDDLNDYMDSIDPGLRDTIGQIGIYQSASEFYNELANFFSSKSTAAAELNSKIFNEGIDAEAMVDAYNTGQRSQKALNVLSEYKSNFENALVSYKNTVMRDWITKARNGNFMYSALLMKSGTFFKSDFANPFELGLNYANQISDTVGNALNVVLDFIPGGKEYMKLGKAFNQGRPASTTVVRDSKGNIKSESITTYE